MPLSICSDSEEEERPRSAKTSVDLTGSSDWPSHLVDKENVSSRREAPIKYFINILHFTIKSV